MQPIEEQAPQQASEASHASVSQSPTHTDASDTNHDPLAEAFHHGQLSRLLEEYVALCHPPREADEKAPKGRASPPAGERFPNLAGFCRYLGCATEEWLSMERDYPIPFGRLRAVLEDEALNASLSPTVVGAYLKRRLGYDKESDTHTEPMSVRFEHDIWEDGE